MFLQGGSLGKGTAVKGKSDIDLTVMLANYTEVRALKKDMSLILGTLKQYLDHAPVGRVIKTTYHAVVVELPSKAGYMHTVDVLPAVNVFKTYSREQG